MKDQPDPPAASSTSFRDKCSKLWPDLRVKVTAGSIVLKGVLAASGELKEAPESEPSLVEDLESPVIEVRGGGSGGLDLGASGITKASESGLETRMDSRRGR